MPFLAQDEKHQKFSEEKMSESPYCYEGGCHCGGIAVRIESEHAASDRATRRCGCSFCATRGALYATDPGDRVTFRIKDKETLQRYRFGHGSADFLLCSKCGSFLGAFMDGEGDEEWGYAVPNLMNLNEKDLFPAPSGTPMDYDSESKDDRLMRRRARWSRAKILFDR